MQGLIHRHKHKRATGLVEGEVSLYWKTFLDKTTMVAGVLGPIMVAPQIYKIFSTHEAHGVSALSWFAFAVLDIPFIAYGMLHEDRPIVTTYTLFCIANVLVATGAVLYS